MDLEAVREADQEPTGARGGEFYDWEAEEEKDLRKSDTSSGPVSFSRGLLPSFAAVSDTDTQSTAHTRTHAHNVRLRELACASVQDYPVSRDDHTAAARFPVHSFCLLTRRPPPRTCAP